MFHTRPSTTNAIHADEAFDCFVKLQLPQGAEVSDAQVLAFLESPGHRVTAELSYLESNSSSSIESGHQSSRSQYGTPNASTPRGLGMGVRTPGFPYTPAPFPMNPQGEETSYESYQASPTIYSQAWNMAAGCKRWTSPKEQPFVIWMLPCNRISECVAWCRELKLTWV